MLASTLAGFALALALMLAATMAAAKAQRVWLWRATALVVLYEVALVLAGLSPTVAPWGSAIAAAAVLLTAQPLLALGLLSRREIGLAPPRGGSVRPAVLATVVGLALNATAIALRGAAPVELTTAELAALVGAALLEELVFRGVLLALADRAWPPHWNIGGAPIGWGSIAVMLAFVALHGLSAGMVIGILPASVLYLWLRARTASLAPPILAHLAWNAAVVLMH